MHSCKKLLRPGDTVPERQQDISAQGQLDGREGTFAVRMGFLGREVPGLTRPASRVSEAFITGTSGLNLSPLGTPALNERGLAWTSEYLGFIPLEQNCAFYGLVRKGFMEEVPVQPRLQRWVGFQKAETLKRSASGWPMSSL